MSEYPSIYEAKKLIVEVGKRMYDKGLVAANDGNISCRISPDMILATPTGVSKGFMDPDSMVKMTIDGKVLSDGGVKPSSEVKMHLRVYQENPRILAVTHAHPPVATSFAIAGIGLDQPILTEALMSLGSVPIARYATPGTQEVPDSIAPFCVEYNAVLLANHGALTWGGSLMQAYFRMESLEYYATIMMYTNNIIGRANKLSCDQIGPLLGIREKLGISGGGIPACSLFTLNNQNVMPATGPIDDCMHGATSCGISDDGRNNQNADFSRADIEEIVKQVTLEILTKMQNQS